jgi:murein L,D-transpeptidase YafK
MQCSGCALFREDTQALARPVIVEGEAPHTNAPWIEVSSRHKRLTVHRPGQSPVVFQGVAFGAAGVREKRAQGDHVTPRGRYTIGWISKQSKFVNFIGLNYPSVQDAERGYRSGVITQATYSRIRDSHAGGSAPPQTTRLGGFIGIHGVGKGSLEIHRMANWTEGCIALDNDQIRELVKLVTPGMLVEIN